MRPDKSSSGQSSAVVCGSGPAGGENCSDLAGSAVLQTTEDAATSASASRIVDLMDGMTSILSW